LVPEPRRFEFDGTWYDFDGFSIFPEFLAKEFGVPRGSWVIEKVSGKGTGVSIEEKGVVRIWGDERVAYATLVQLVIQGRGRLPRVRIVEEFRFSFRGFHLDVARGGVPTVDYLKKLLKWLFLLKYNYLALYLEDLFPWERYPDIGVHRGRYTRDELREVIEYGQRLGIEVFPSLELLGHMENILMLPPYMRYSEWHNPGEGVLNVADEEARRFGLNLLEEVLDFFPSRYIHIGGDETWALGRGKSLDVTGVFRGPELYEEYTRLLVEAVARRGKVPMIWGDMIRAAYLRESEKALWRRVLESPIWREAVIANWDYSPRDIEHFRKVIRELSEKGLKQVVAPGLWNWNRFYPDYVTALTNLRNFLTAAREDQSVIGFLVTAWGDDGSECLFTYLNPLILAAMEIAEGSGSWEEKWIALTGEDRRVTEARKIFGEVDTVVNEWSTRWGFWLPKQVLLKTRTLRMYEKYLPKELLDRLRKDLEKALEASKGVELPKELQFIKEFYEATLKALNGSIRVSDYIRLAEMYRDLWLSERKPHGLEEVIGKFWRAAGVTELEKALKS
ncbi:MAG: beta-N-acetylhexosaminidase, partial [Ignisphaera sp.]|nr:beta-N-acetylhexosaminidase [Ignisphaera sp.]